MAQKSAPFSMRLTADLDKYATDEARRTQRSKGAIVMALADEGLRMRLFPGIAFRGEDWKRRAWVVGTAMDVWEIIRTYEDVGSIACMVSEGALSEQRILLALAYYERFPEEIDGFISDDRRTIDELHELYPTIDILVVDT